MPLGAVANSLKGIMMLIDKNSLVKILQENSSVEVKFKKKSTGEDRVMLCTLNKQILEADGAARRAQQMPKTIAEMIANDFAAVPIPERKTPDYIVHVYDIEASHWKSFDINTVYEVNYE